MGILLRQGMGSEPEGDMEHVDGAPELHNYTKFIAICRVLLDVGSKGAGRNSHDPIYRAGGPVPRFEIDNTFCLAPERTTILVYPLVGTELASGWTRIRWDEIGFGIHLLVDPGAWRILAFSLTDENGEGAAHLSAMLYSALDEYVVGEILLPRASPAS